MRTGRTIALLSACAIGLSSGALAGGAGPEKPKAVIELFTSQGCSSCPPADAVLGRIVAEGDVIALSYHVDYWNYLGWKDTLSSKEATERQYGYARTLGRQSVYTPQVVIDGSTHVVGSDHAAIRAKVKALAASGEGLRVPVSARQTDGKVTISIGAGTDKADIVLVYFDRSNTVEIKRGENSGRKITYWHTVRDVQTVGMWDGKPMQLVMPTAVVKGSSTGGCAILLQKMGQDNAPGPILGATVVQASRKEDTAER